MKTYSPFVLIYCTFYFLVQLLLREPNFGHTHIQTHPLQLSTFLVLQNYLDPDNKGFVMLNDK